MDAYPTKTYPAGSPEWLQQRRTALGGSEIATILGLSPWKSHYTLWWEKKGHQPHPMNPIRAAIGHGLEQTAADLFTTRHPEYSTMRTGCWQSKTRPWQLAEPDRLVCLPGSRKPIGFIEIKTVDTSSAWQWGPDRGGNNDIPPYYLTQVQWYMSTLGIHTAWLVALIGYSEYREYEIQHDPSLEQKILTTAKDFITSLKNNTPPDPDTSTSTYETIREQHPQITPNTTTDISQELAAEYLQASEAYKNAETRLTGAKTQLALAMGDTQYATWRGIKLARRMARGTTGTPYVTATPKGLHDVKALLCA